MRVITGCAKGRRLRELPGLDTRPTTGRVKEGLFSAVQFELEGRRVLDLFAGTGQLGIEALSRGAAWCDFVDRAPAAVKVVRENLRVCALEQRAAVYQKDFSDFLSAPRGPYGVVFLDPPYASGSLDLALKRISDVDILVENGIIVCESPAEHALPELPGPYERDRDYRYGKIRLTVYRRRRSV